MTRSQIRAYVRENIEDQGSFYTNADLNNAIQECYTKYTNNVKTIEKRVVLDFVGDLTYYNFRTLIPDFLRLNSIYNNVNKRWLKGKPRLWLDGMRIDWETMTGSAQWFSVINPELIAIVPHPVITEGQMDVYYAASAPIVTTDGYTYLTLPESDLIFALYSDFYLMLQAKEFIKAKQALKEFARLVKDAKNSMNGRGLPTRFYTLGG